jgi:hypothetical protein
MLKRLVDVVVNEEGDGMVFPQCGDSLIIVEFDLRKITATDTEFPSSPPLQRLGYPFPSSSFKPFSRNSNSPL